MTARLVSQGTNQKNVTGAHKAAKPVTLNGEECGMAIGEDASVLSHPRKAKLQKDKDGVSGSGLAKSGDGRRVSGSSRMSVPSPSQSRELLPKMFFLPQLNISRSFFGVQQEKNHTTRSHLRSPRAGGLKSFSVIGCGYLILSPPRKRVVRTG